MKISTKVTLHLILIVFRFVNLSAQKPQTKTVEIETVKSTKSKEYKTWQKIDLPTFTFYIPQELRAQETKCTEGGCYTFKDENVKLHIDVNSAAGFPTYEKEHSTFSEKFARIDKADAWIWFVENDKYKYESGVLFKFEKNENYRIGMYLFSNNKETKAIAEKIFKSVKFKQIRERR